MLTKLLIPILTTGWLSAATINFEEIASPTEADVNSLPNLITAKNFGGTSGTVGGAETVTANGITFDASPFAAGFNFSVADPLGNIDIVDGDSHFDTFAASPTNFGSPLDDLFKGLIRASHALQDGERNFTVHLSGLTTGDAYQLQLFFSSGTQSRSAQIEDSNFNLIGTWDNTSRESIIQLTFLANQATETITIAQDIGDAAVLSALSFSVDTDPANTSPPSDISLSRNTLNHSGAAIGETLSSLTSNDPDIGDTQTFALATGAGDTDNGSFQINGDNLDFNANLTAGTYSVRISVTDTAFNTYEEAFTITVIDDLPPENLVLEGNLIAINGGATQVLGTITADDPNLAYLPEEFLTYELVTGSGDTDNLDFDVDLFTGVVTYFGTPNLGSTYSIRVRVTDDAGLFTEDSFTFTVAETVGATLTARGEITDSDTRVLHPNNVSMSGGKTASGVAIFIQNAAVQSGRLFKMLLLRPTGNPDEFNVVYDSGEITVTGGSDGSVAYYDFPNGSIDLQTGDIFAHYGRGIPFTTDATAPPIYFPVEVPPASGSTIILGATGDYQQRTDLARDYAWSVVVADRSTMAAINLCIERDTTNTTLSWNATAGKTYLIKGSTDLQNWTDTVEAAFSPTTTDAEYTLNTPANTVYFFRITENP